MSRFGIQACVLNGTQQPGTAGYLLDRGAEVNSEGSDGTLNETFHHIIRRRPTVDLQTMSLKAIVSALNDSTDLPLKALNGTTGLVMYGAKQAAGAPGHASGANHVSRTGLRGVLYMAGLRWSVGQKAEATLKGLFYSADGTTASVSEANTATLPTQPFPDFGFGLYSASCAGNTLDGVNSVELSIEPRFEFDYTTGLPEPTGLYAAGVAGRMSIAARLDIGDQAVADGTGSCVLVFKRFAQGGGFGSDTLTLTLNSAWALEEQFGGRDASPMGRPLTVRTRHDGTTKPLTWAVA